MPTPVTWDTNGNALYKCQYCGLLVNSFQGGYNTDQSGGDQPVDPGTADVPSDTTDAPLFDICPALPNGQAHAPF